jgi:hypothetical protein
VTSVTAEPHKAFNHFRCGAVIEVLVLSWGDMVFFAVLVGHPVKTDLGNDLTEKSLEIE